MTDLERDLYWEMVRTVKLLGGKSDILDALAMMDSDMSQNETIGEIYTLVKCWNDNVHKQLESIPENELYETVDQHLC